MEATDEPYLTLMFNRPIGLEDLDYRVVDCSDLTDWTGGAVWVSTTPAEAHMEEVVYRHPESVGAGPRAYLRLEVRLK